MADIEDLTTLKPYSDMQEFDLVANSSRLDEYGTNLNAMSKQSFSEAPKNDEENKGDRHIAIQQQPRPHTLCENQPP
jgi:hypothetical protein